MSRKKSISLGMRKVTYTLKFFFISPKPKTEETEYRRERKSFRIDYGKYYTKKESFTLLMSSITLLTFTGECLLMSVFLIDDLVRFLFIGALILFYMVHMKNVSRIRGKYKERAIEEGQYG